MTPAWSTACLDWQERIIEGRGLIPFAPLFPGEARAAIDLFSSLTIVDAAGRPTFGEAARPWIFDFVGAIFGAYDPETGKQLINRFFKLISKKNGKALCIQTLVATPCGFTTMGQLDVGDLVLDSDGKPTKVTWKSPVMLGRECFEVEFSTGETIVCDADHLWVTDAHRDRARARTWAGEDRKAPKPSVKTTREIAASVKVPSGQYTINNHRTSLCGALDLPEADLPIPPYALGIWLGNGASAEALVTAGLIDAEHIVGQLVANGQDARVRQWCQEKGSAIISLADRSRAGYRFRSAARRLGLLGNKHIPTIYLRASRDQRLALLRGLMDTDGTITKRGQASYSTSAPRLRDDIRELINSLGFKSTCAERRACLDDKDYGPAWNIQFWPFDETLVFSRARHVARQNARQWSSAPRSRTRQIVDVRKVPSVPVQCISVESESRQFLVTRSLIPTHNSTESAGIMITALMRNWRESGEFYILAPTKEIADNSYIPARDMVRAHPVLSSVLKPSAGRVIEHRNTGAFLKVIAADSETVTGKKTIGLLVEELHVFGKRANAESILLEIEGGLAARPEGFVVYLSTMADGPPAGVFAQKLEEFRAIRDGKIVVPSSLPVLYEFPPALLKDEAFRRPENWYVTNPNLGVSVDETYLSQKLAEAERAGRAQLAQFFAKHLNVQIGNALRADGWAGATIWERGLEPALTLDTLLDRSEVVTIGIDGGGLDDLLGVAVIGRERGTGRWLGWAHGLVSTIGVWRRKANAVDYLRFKKAGDLTIFSFSGSDEASFAEDPEIAGLLEDVPPPAAAT
jgi:phage terminase large subunit-like protein